MERPSGSRAASVLVNVFLRGLKKKLNSTLMSESLRKKQAISTMMERLAQKGIEQAQRKNSLTTAIKPNQTDASSKTTSRSLHQKVKQFKRGKVSLWISCLLLPWVSATNSSAGC